MIWGLGLGFGVTNPAATMDRDRVRGPIRASAAALCDGQDLTRFVKPENTPQMVWDLLLAEYRDVERGRGGGWHMRVGEDLAVVWRAAKLFNSADGRQLQRNVRMIVMADVALRGEIRDERLRAQRQQAHPSMTWTWEHQRKRLLADALHEEALRMAGMPPFDEGAVFRANDD